MLRDHSSDVYEPWLGFFINESMRNVWAGEKLSFGGLMLLSVFIGEGVQAGVHFCDLFTNIIRALTLISFGLSSDQLVDNE